MAGLKDQAILQYKDLDRLVLGDGERGVQCSEVHGVCSNRELQRKSGGQGGGGMCRQQCADQLGARQRHVTRAAARATARWMMGGMEVLLCCAASGQNQT